METARVTPVRLDREDEKKMLPCRFFANGYCHKGNRCRFYHPLNMNLSSIIRVPPLPPNFGTGRSSSPDVTRSGGVQVQPPSPPPLVREPRIPPLMPMSAPVQHRVAPVPSMNPYLHHVQAPPMPNEYANYRPGVAAPLYNMMDYELPAPQYHPRPHSPSQPVPQSPMYEPPLVHQIPNQNTLFSHIDWSEFLAPGQAPPPPTLVPDDQRDRFGQDSKGSSLMESSDEAPSTSASNEDMPPEGRSQRKLTAREELQMKVRQIAKELAEEPVTPIHSLDSFLRNFTYNGFSPQAAKLKMKKPVKDALKPVEIPKAGGDGSSCEIQSQESPQPQSRTSSEHFTVRDMADALIEIYIANEREREEKGNDEEAGTSST